MSAMEADTGTRLREVRVDGGAAASDLLMQFQADLLGVRVARPENLETTALGAAFMAGLSVGVWPDLAVAREDACGRADVRRAHAAPREPASGARSGAVRSSAPGTGNRMKREDMLRRLDAAGTWDVVVVGGGATGLGVAVDAQSRGYRTLLLEQADFASATSSRSTKLVHGGVRYLEQGDLGLVMEALHERGLLHANAPHVARNLPFIVPRYRWWEGPFYGIGLKTYDLLAGKLNLAPSRVLDREETIARIPNVEQEDLLGGVMYFDGQFDDARMAVTLAQTAADLGACVLNYARVTGLSRRGGVVAGVAFRDLESGEDHTVEARAVVNAAGIFADRVRRLDDADAPPAVQPSQGVHLVFDRQVPRRRIRDHGPAHRRRPRPLRHPLARPGARRHDRHGDAGAGDGAAAAARRDRLHPPQRRPLPRHGPDARRRALRLRRAAAARARARQGDPRASRAATRCSISASGLVTIVGGKWTTYRRMAQDTLDRVIEVGGLPPRPCSTETLRLHGWKPSDPAAPADPLALYGTDAAAIEGLDARGAGAARAARPAPALPRARSSSGRRGTRWRARSRTSCRVGPAASCSMPPRRSTRRRRRPGCSPASSGGTTPGRRRRSRPTGGSPPATASRRVAHAFTQIDARDP